MILKQNTCFHPLQNCSNITRLNNYALDFCKILTCQLFLQNLHIYESNRFHHIKILLFSHKLK